MHNKLASCLYKMDCTYIVALADFDQMCYFTETPLLTSGNTNITIPFADHIFEVGLSKAQLAVRSGDSEVFKSRVKREYVLLFIYINMVVDVKNGTIGWNFNDIDSW